MRNPLGFSVAIAGVVLVIFGVTASGSLSSHVSNTVREAPSDASILLIIGGLVVTGIGCYIVWAGLSRPR